jgi:hypothetical protein
VVDCQVEEGWVWSACDSTCGQGHATRSRAVTVEACNGGAACPTLTQTKVCMTQVCECEQVYCQYDLQHTCTDYTDAAASLYHDVGAFSSSYGGTDGVSTGQGVGDKHGTQTSIDTHNGAAACAPSDSVRVYHANGSPAEGHHCRYVASGGTCSCRCNTLFKGDYNPKDTDLFDHVISLAFDAPTPQPTSWPTEYPTAQPTSYPTEPAPTVQEVAAQTSSATTEVTLEGITASEFTADVEQAVEEAVAAQYEVHVSQVTVEVVTSSRRRLTSAGLNLLVTIEAPQAKVVEVQTEMQQIADVPALKESFASVINEFLEEAVAQGVAPIIVTVEACTPPVVATGAPTSSPTKAPTSSPTSSPTKAPTTSPTVALPTCTSHEGSVHAFCSGVSVKRWGIGPEGEAQAIVNCNFAAERGLHGLHNCVDMLALPTCMSHEGSVHAFCGGVSVKRWGIGPEGEAKAIGNCNYAARTSTFGLDICATYMHIIDAATDTPPRYDASFLLISEYIEGSSYTKGLELFNPTHETISLDETSIQFHTNGAVSDASQNFDIPTSQFAGSSIPPGGTFVICKDVRTVNSRTNHIEPTGECNMHVPSSGDFTNVLVHNGDDAIELKYEGATIDVIGVVGEDPGSCWKAASGGCMTKDKTIRRKFSITSGSTTWDNTQWDIFNADTVDGAGAHSGAMLDAGV